MSAAPDALHGAACRCHECDFARRFKEEQGKTRESSTRQIAAAQKLQEAIRAIEKGDSKLIRLPKKEGGV